LFINLLAGLGKHTCSIAQSFSLGTLLEWLACRVRL
jgi:hypothetical protein